MLRGVWSPHSMRSHILRTFTTTAQFSKAAAATVTPVKAKKHTHSTHILLCMYEKACCLLLMHARTEEYNSRTHTNTASANEECCCKKSLVALSSLRFLSSSCYLLQFLFWFSMFSWRCCLFFLNFLFVVFSSTSLSKNSVLDSRESSSQVKVFSPVKVNAGESLTQTNDIRIHKHTYTTLKNTSTSTHIYVMPNLFLFYLALLRDYRDSIVPTSSSCVVLHYF